MNMNTDSLELMRVFAALGNRTTGLGTGRDKTRHASVNAPAILSPREVSSLHRTNNSIARVVDAYPLDAASAWMTVQVGEGEPADDLEQYIRGIGQQEDHLDNEPDYSPRDAFSLAARFARLHGNGAILVGIADGLDPSQPVDMNAIQSVRWLLPVPRESITPHGAVYHINDLRSGTAAVWHKSRVLWFRGAAILDPTDGDAIQGFDDSVIQRMYEAFSSHWGAVASASTMIQDFDQGVFSAEGLAEMMRGTDAEKRQIMERFASLDLGRSVVRSVVLDRSLESFDYVSRDFGGVKDIMGALRDEWVAASGLPAWKLFGTTTGAGLATANTAGLAARFEWAGLVHSWMASNFVPQFDRLVRLCFAARDCPMDEPETWEVVPNDAIELTPLEHLEMQKVAAERDQINIALGIYTKEEARRQYEATRFTGQIVVSEDYPMDAAAVLAHYNAGLIDAETAARLLGYDNPGAIAARLNDAAAVGYADY